jgi:predicted ArsR family transcriptional regulator
MIREMPQLCGHDICLVLTSEADLLGRVTLTPVRWNTKMSKPAPDDNLPFRALAHLAGAESSQPLADISLALRLVSPVRLKRVMIALANAQYVRHEAARLEWSNGTRAFSRPASTYAITAKGRKAVTVGRLPFLSIAPSPRSKPISSTANALRTQLRERILTFLGAQETPASLAEIVEGLASRHTNDTIRFVLDALTTEGVVTSKTIFRTHRYFNQHREVSLKRSTRVFSLVKRTAAKRNALR